jgi:hypothetical protein
MPGFSFALAFLLKLYNSGDGIDPRQVKGDLKASQIAK